MLEIPLIGWMLPHIAAGIVRAASFMGFTWFAEKYGKWKQDKLQIIVGTYYSTYSDPKNCEDRKPEPGKSEKAIIFIRQSGTSFSGMTHTLDNKQQEWELEGKITDKKYIEGSYKQTYGNETSRGVFFLEPTYNEQGARKYEGGWCGHDKDTQKVQVGEYYWSRNKDILIESVKHKRCFGLLGKSKHFDNAITIFSNTLGAGYITTDIITSVLDETNSILRIAKSLDGNKEVLGVCLIRIYKKEECEKIDSNSNGVLRLSEIPKLGYIQSVAVSEQVRGCGVASQLIDDALINFKKWGCTAAFAIAWRPSNNKDSLGTLKVSGFKEIKTIENYWKESSVAEGFRCPACGEPPCLCSASFMYKPNL